MTAPVNPPPRLLMGPGPVNADPRVLRALSTPLVGQYDPVMTGYMNETMALYREVFATTNEATLLVDGTSRAGIEAALVSLVRPGERVLVPVFGRFGHLLAEIALRAQAEVHTIEVPWGQVFAASAVEEAIVRVRPHLLAMVQGDTSTTMLQPLDELGRDLREARRAVLHGRDRVAGRQPVRDGRVGSGRRHGRAAEVPVGPVGQRADQPVGQGRRGDPGASPHRGRDPRGVRRGHRRARALQLLRPRHDPRLLGTAAAQPPHRGDEHAVRGAGVRADHRRGGPAGRHRPARAGRPRDARGGPGPGAGGVRGRGAQDEQRGRGRDPGRRGRRRRARRAAAGLRHRDRHVVRPAARSRLADRHDGRQRAARHRADHARRARAGAAPARAPGCPHGGGVDAAYSAWSAA